jgi:hypothetical protein
MLRWEPGAEFFQRGHGSTDFINEIEVVEGALYIVSRVAYDYSFAVAMRLDSWLSLERLLAVGPGIIGVSRLPCAGLCRR